MGREEHLNHPVRAVAAAVSQARIGYGPWRVSRGARENIPRELRVCLHCSLRVAETVSHCLCECPLFDDLRTAMMAKLSPRLSQGLLTQLGHPADDPDLWTQVLLQGRPAELGDEFCISFRALAKLAAAKNVSAAPLSLAQQFAAETRLMLAKLALNDRYALSSVGHRFVYNVVRRRLALERRLENPSARVSKMNRASTKRRRL